MAETKARPCHCGREKQLRKREVFPRCSGCTKPVGACECAPLLGVPACCCGRPVYPDEDGRPRCLKCNGLAPERCFCLPLSTESSSEVQP